MQPLRYSINITLDGCCDHLAGVPDAELHQHSADILGAADTLLFGRVVYQMMEEAWRPVAESITQGGVKPDWGAALDGAVRPDDRQDQEVRRVEHPRPRRLERRAAARRSGHGRAGSSSSRRAGGSTPAASSSRSRWRSWA